MLLRPEILKAGLSCASKDLARESINGIRLERSSPTTFSTIATDGKRLFWSRVKEDGWAEFPDVGLDLAPKDGWAATIPNSLAAQFAKPIRKPIKPILGNVGLEENGGQIRMATTDLDSRKEATATAIDAPYPDYRSVMPTEGETPCAEVRLNPYYLKDAAEAAIGLIDNKENPCVTLRIYSDDRPTWIDFRGTYHETRIGLMPLVFDDHLEPAERAKTLLARIGTMFRSLDVQTYNIAMRNLAEWATKKTGMLEGDDR